MNRQKLISELERANTFYGEQAEEAFESGNREEGIKYGHMADAHGEAAKALRNGRSRKYVNSRWNGILDF